MRITGGRHRGRVLRQPVLPGVRPTADRVREAIFSIVGQDLTGSSVLDAFGGTGLLGLEAWSRGARVIVCERDRRVAKQIEERARELGALEGEFQVRIGDVLASTPDVEPVDGVLVDPPWAGDPRPIVTALAPLARQWLVLEADAAGEQLPDAIGTLQLDRVREYGRTRLWIFRAPTPALGSRVTRKTT